MILKLRLGYKDENNPMTENLKEARNDQTDPIPNPLNLISI